MRRVRFTFTSVIFITTLFASGITTAHDAGAPVCEEAKTIFHDVSRIGRKDRAAANMTRRHADMALEGWRFKDKVLYTENGDLEGFYITYTRKVACPDENSTR